jgi:hypothetical protein
VRFRKWRDSHRGRHDERSTNAGLQRQSPGQAICYINKFDPVCLHHQALTQVGFYGSVLTYAGRTKQLCLNGDVQSVKAGSLSRCCARHPPPGCTLPIHGTTSTSLRKNEIEPLRYEGDLPNGSGESRDSGRSWGPWLSVNNNFQAPVRPRRSFSLYPRGRPWGMVRSCEAYPRISFCIHWHCPWIPHSLGSAAAKVFFCFK